MWKEKRLLKQLNLRMNEMNHTASTFDTDEPNLVDILGHIRLGYYLNTKTYEYDPHLDPQLIWAGKTEHTSFEVVRKGSGQIQTSLFELPDENPPLRTAVEFYIL